MSLETEIRARLAADSTLSGLVSTRLYALKLPQEPTYPAVTYQRISGPRLSHLSGSSDFGTARLQIDSWGKPYLSVQSVAAAIRVSLHGYHGMLSTLRVAIQLDNERDEYDDDAEIYRVSQDYRLQHSE